MEIVDKSFDWRKTGLVKIKIGKDGFNIWEKGGGYSEDYLAYKISGDPLVRDINNNFNW